jgi:hypothetical protein
VEGGQYSLPDLFMSEKLGPFDGKEDSSVTQYPVNIDPRPPVSLHDDLQLLAQVSRVPPSHVVAEFTASGRRFRVLMLCREPLKDMTNMMLDVSVDADDADASRKGFTVRNTLAAIDTADGKPYAVWEFYSVGDVAPFRSKAMDVDKNHKRLGIGRGMFKAVKDAGYSIVPSGKQTDEGSGLLQSLSRDGII